MKKTKFYVPHLVIIHSDMAEPNLAALEFERYCNNLPPDSLGMAIHSIRIHVFKDDPKPSPDFEELIKAHRFYCEEAVTGIPGQTEKRDKMKNQRDYVANELRNYVLGLEHDRRLLMRLLEEQSVKRD